MHQGRKSREATHFIRDCPHLSDSDRTFILKMYERGLKHRLLAVDEWDEDIRECDVEEAEAYYDVTPVHRSIEANGGGQQESIAEIWANRHRAVSIVDIWRQHQASRDSRTLSAGDIWVSKHQTTPVETPERAVVQRVPVLPSPSAMVDFVTMDGRRIQEEMVADTGCTGAGVINIGFARKLGIVVKPTEVHGASQADGETNIKFVGEASIEGNFEGNPIKCRAFVAEKGDSFLLGRPGLEDNRIDIILSASPPRLAFPNGASCLFKTTEKPLSVWSKELKIRRVLLRSPKYKTILTAGQLLPVTWKEEDKALMGEDTPLAV